MESKLYGACSKCNAQCCSKYSVCLNGYDVARLVKATDNSDWIDIIYAEDTEPEIAHSFSLYRNGKRENFILCLMMKDDGNCIFLGENYFCKVYESRPMICRIYPFNQKISGSLNYKENIRCPMKWNLNGPESKEFLKDIEKNKKELEDYGKWCEEWNSLLTPEKKLADFLEFIVAKGKF